MQIVIAGAGPIGLIAARGLEVKGHSALLFDPTTEKPKMSLALAESTLTFLDSLGISEPVGEDLTQIHVSERGVPGSALIDAKVLGYPRFGRAVCSQKLEKILIESLDGPIQTRNVVDVKARTAVENPRVKLEDGSVLAPDLVIVADGGRSHLTESLGLKPSFRPFGRSAILGRIRVERPVLGRAYERFVGTGPLAILPLCEDLYGFVWSVEPARAKYLQTDRCALENLLAAAVDPELGAIHLASEAVVIPLIERWIDRPFRPGVVLFGNGAQTIHPVAGQGLNLALRGLKTFIDTLDYLGPDQAVIDAFGSWSNDRERTRLLSSSLEVLFNQDGALRRLGTSLGLSMLDQSPWLKRRIAEAGMGLLS